MMKIIYTDHLKLRMKLRSVPKHLPLTILEKPSERYYDTITKHQIAIATVMLKGKIKEYMLGFDEIDDRVELITIHPIKPAQKLARVRSGRWRLL